MFPKRGAIAIALTGVALVLLLSFKTPDQVATATDGDTAVVQGAPSTTSVPDASAAPGAAAPDASAAPDATAAPAPTPTSEPAAAGTTVTGPEVDNQFGPVQVEVTIAGGKITDVSAVQLPSGGRSGRISQRAASRLRQEVLQAQSAAIDGVSGATYTSEAYAQSLQAALDQAGF